MKHQYWINQIHLSGGDELTRVEQEALNKHLAECVGCRTIYLEIHQNWTALKQEFQGEPVLTDPGLLSDAIMRLVERKTGASRSRRLTSSQDLLDLLFGQRTRLALQLFATLLLSVFIVEQVQLTQSLRIFEKEVQIHAQSFNRARISLLPESIREKLLSKIPAEIKEKLMVWSADDVKVSGIYTWHSANDLAEIRKRFPEQRLRALFNALNPDLNDKHQ